MNLNLTYKVFLVTGGAKGIGAAIRKDSERTAARSSASPVTRSVMSRRLVTMEGRIDLASGPGHQPTDDSFVGRRLKTMSVFV